MGSSKHLGQKIEQAVLWVAHYYLTRAVIIDAVNHSPYYDSDLAALYQNQKDLGAVFTKLTGSTRAGNELAYLLKEHITIALELVTMTMTGANTTPAYEMWQINADKIARLYSKYDKHINYVKINNMMQEHLRTTLAEATDIIQHNVAASAVSGAIALEHIKMMANYLNGF